MGQQPRTVSAARALSACIAALFGLAIALPVAADTIIVRYPDSVTSADAATLPAAELAKLSRALDGGFRLAGRTRDGGFRLQLDNAMEPEQLRAAVNQIRLTSKVLYANVEPTSPRTAPSGPLTDRLIVKYRDSARPAAAGHRMALNVSEVERLSALGGQPLVWTRNTHDGAQVLQMMRLLPRDEVEVVAAALARQPDIEYAEADGIWAVQMMPVDPCYAGTGCGSSYQWDLFDPVGGINMPTAWDQTIGAANIKVAIVDTGVLPSHPDLAGRILPGYDMIGDAMVGNDGNGRDTDANDPGDWVSAAESSSGYFAGCGASNSSWHGTHLAGTIGAVPNNGQGIAGINWVSGMVPVRVLGKCGGYMSDINDGVVWAAGGAVPGVPANANPARVINVSLGGSGACPASTQAAINTALGLGAVIAVAAGNSNANAASFSPASCSGVITVAATTKTGSRAYYSNYGTVVEIAAPGGDATSGGYNILSTLNNGTTSPNPAGYGYVSYAGTSMATPHVSGVASLLLSTNPALTPAQVIAKLQGTARAFPAGSSCTTANCGAGILDAGAALGTATTAPVATATTVASALNPAAYGTGVTFTATVAGTAPAGTVAFKDNGVVLSGCGAVALLGTGNTRTAQCIGAVLAIGTHPVTAAYAGNTTNLASSSAVLSQVVNAAATTTTVTSSLNPATYRSSVTFTATVTGKSPVGAVAFRDNGAVLSGCGAVALVGTSATARTAQCIAPAMATGTHAITAAYAGGTGNLASTSAALSQTVKATTTTTTIASSRNPSLAGAVVAYTAVVTGYLPSGTVSFTDNGVTIAACSAVALPGSSNSRKATCSYTITAKGGHVIAGRYTGDANNLTSSGTMTETIN